MSRILVVDDNDAISLLLTHMLSEHGYEVVVAGNAQEAVKAILKQKPDLILLDVQLPDVGGFQLCELLRKQPATQSVPIIMITGTAISGKEKATGLHAGADDYMTKPFEPDELLERVRAVLRRSVPVSLPLEPLGPDGQIARAAPASADPVLEFPPARGSTAVQAVFQALSSPRHLTGELPPVSLLFLLALMGLSALCSVVTSDMAVQPLIVCLLAILLWGILASTLVVSASLVGLSLTWKEGSRLMSLACLPLLLKLLGGTVLAASTSVSPFLYSAGPALLMHPAPFWLYRIDLYEIWSVVLLWILVKSRPRSTAGKTSIVSLLTWAVAMFVLFCIQHLHGKV